MGKQYHINGIETEKLEMYTNSIKKHESDTQQL
jgi:hypothetical protein